MATREEMIQELKRRDMIAQLKARDAAGAPAGPAPGEEALIQEQSPGVSGWQRFVAKNFAVSPEASMGYLRSKLPEGSDVREIRGQIGVKLPGETTWKALDPDTGAISSDILGDLGDVAYDVGSGAVQGAATGLGAAGGALGMAAAGGASGAGLEALRQKIGSALGIPNNEDNSQIALAGGLGAALGPAEKLVGAGYNLAKSKVGPKMAEMASGVPAKVWKDFAQNSDRVVDLAKDPAKSLALVDDIKDTVVGSYQRQLGAAGKEIEGALAQASQDGAQVDISPIKKALRDKISRAEAIAKENPTPASLQKLDDLKAVERQYFIHENTTPQMGLVSATYTPDKVSPDLAFRLKEQLRELASPVPGAASKLKNPSDKEIMNFGNTAMKDITGQMTKAVPGLERANARYSTLMDEAGAVNQAFKDAPTTAATARNLDSQSKKVLKERLSKTLSPDEVSGLQDKLQALQTQAYLGDPASLPLSGLGSTSTSRTVPMSILGGSLGTLAGYKMGGGYAGAAVGGALGAKLGSAAGSPATIKRGYQLLINAEKAGSKIPVNRAGAYGTGLGTWEALQQRQD